ncbi:hypothetical protein ACV07N_15840 [Roseivirga echinicomitans]
MKKIYSLLIGLCLLTFACGEDPNDITALNADVVFKVDLSGAFTSNFVQDSVSSFTHANLIIIEGIDKNKNKVTVTIDPNYFASGANVKGSHEVGQGNAPARIVVNIIDGGLFYLAQSGNVTVTEYSNKVIKGTFSFEATEYKNNSSTVSGTNGQFTATLIDK